MITKGLIVPSVKPGVKVVKSPTEMSELEDRTYTLDEVATIFEVNVQTVRAWVRNPVKSGLVATKTAGNRKGYSVSRAALVQFAIRRYM